MVSAPVTLIAFTISSFLFKPSLDSPFNSHTTSSAEEPFIFNKASKTHTVRYSTQNSKKEALGLRKQLTGTQGMRILREEYIMEFLISYYLCLKTAQLMNCRFFFPALYKIDAPHIKTHNIFLHCYLCICLFLHVIHP